MHNKCPIISISEMIFMTGMHSSTEIWQYLEELRLEGLNEKAPTTNSVHQLYYMTNTETLSSSSSAAAAAAAARDPVLQLTGNHSS